MLEILRVDPAGRPAGEPVVDTDGARVGTVTNTDDGDRYVSVDPDAPTDTLDALGWTAGDDAVRLPDRLVAEESEDGVRLVV